MKTPEQIKRLLEEAYLDDTSDECLLAKAELEGIRQNNIELAARNLADELLLLGYGKASDRPLPGSFDELQRALDFKWTTL